jgi:hypothetical protein
LHQRLRNRHLPGPPGKLKEAARALVEPPITQEEARSEGWELEDYESEVLHVWPDNLPAVRMFQRIGTRWCCGPSGCPTGLRWEAIYPLMDRLGLLEPAWRELLEDLEVMEHAALAAMSERLAKK